MTMSPATPPTKQHQVNPSPFANEVSPKLCSEQIAAQISAEIKRMHRRKQLNFPMSPSPPSSGGSSPNPHSSGQQHMAGSHVYGSHSQSDMSQCGPSASGSHSPMAAACSSSSLSLSSSPGRKTEVPLFTLRQVSLVCERMLKEREEQIREEYDKVLTSKLAEQYEAFLKFNHDMLHRKFDERPASYVSWGVSKLDHFPMIACKIDAWMCTNKRDNASVCWWWYSARPDLNQPLTPITEWPSSSPFGLLHFGNWYGTWCCMFTIVKCSCPSFHCYNHFICRNYETWLHYC